MPTVTRSRSGQISPIRLRSRTLIERIGSEFKGLDLLVLNASGGMESGMAEDYAMKLNRDAQVDFLRAVLPLLARPSRVVFVTSHQAHFIKTVETMPEYLPVALSKRAGEDALRDLIPELEDAGIGFVVVSGDMIEGTITATLLERANPDAINSRREAAGKLYNVGGVRSRGRARSRRADPRGPHPLCGRRVRLPALSDEGVRSPAADDRGAPVPATRAAAASSSR